MGKGRLEAFTDGVMAIIITIMVLELKVPHVASDLMAALHVEPSLADLKPLCPIVISYILSFLYAGIYWNNHHHLFHAVHKIGGSVLWANLHLLFWLSLTPFTTAWMGENHFATVPVAVYGFVLLMAGVAYFILTRSLMAHHAVDSPLVRAIGSDIKGKLSLVIYATAIGLTFVSRWIGLTLYFVVAIIWLVPDQRIERTLAKLPDTGAAH
ncbi:MAG: hypothetical protein RLY20_1653 [Verrucomicrobiota bacterium]|jgi:uncharacterized membrane protein